MKTVVWIVVGLVIAGLAWVPINLTDPGDIPFIPAILAILGSVAGGVIVLVAVVQWVRHAPCTELGRGPLPSRAVVALALAVREEHICPGGRGRRDLARKPAHSVDHRGRHCRL